MRHVFGAPQAFAGGGQDLDDNATLYGKRLENRDVVTKGVRAPQAAATLLSLLNRYSSRESTD